MKIGVICHDAFPIVEPYQGGLEMVTAILVNELVHRGHQVSSLCLEGSELAGEMIFYSQLEGFHEDLDEELVSLGSVTNSLNRFLSKNFDVIHNNSMHYQSIILGNSIDTPSVTTFHTPIFPPINLGILSIAGYINQTFIGVSECISKLYEEYLPNVQTVYNGIDISLWEVEYENVASYYSWCGRICKEKGLAELMDLCLKENIKLKFAGPISDPEYFKSRIEPFMRQGQFEYIGHLDQKGVNHLIKKSKAYIFSSIWEEPYGLVIAEALACGVPVLANCVGAAPEILDQTSGVLYNINEVESFQEGLNSINNISRHAARKRAESFCSHHRMVDNYENVYQELIDDRVNRRNINC